MPNLRYVRHTSSSESSVEESNATPQNRQDARVGLIAEYVNIPDKTLSPCHLSELKRTRAYRRTSYLNRAEQDIKKLVQNKRREDFRALREALYLVYTYKGPFLQTKQEKTLAALYLRRKGLGKMFVNGFNNEIKWEWLSTRVKDINKQDITHTPLHHLKTPMRLL
ncbi:uncharacterized protein MELLADRAFT_68816 [Melampsora larici-populina 98AG31]|uniref:Uncharacterized protein n=1 Tax=Melampsora larici-populina (strain 98AG31 / pathotype 3-4-7) TaxID=747676 RepID=F4S8A3_MELLP|nr:uncharacterized protein MELLADRAFT_68816 [Melampsora larici-populina 98AG31]EGF99123.1 hypothetical protein MELLADRAFT_68816 [Melampsora larici-populina 98AG31]